MHLFTLIFHLKIFKLEIKDIKFLKENLYIPITSNTKFLTEKGYFKIIKIMFR